MNVEECLNELKAIKSLSFATVDDKGFPQVRIIDLMIVENEKLYFCVSRGKTVYKELQFSSNVALVGLNNNYQMIRLNGKAKQLSDQKYWIDRIFEENLPINNVYPGESRYILEPFCINKGQIEFFDLSKEPIYRECLSFGNESEKVKGFKITEVCIKCGQCQRQCPQQCIDFKDVFSIHQEHCLHCGLCFEVCPVNAIIKREQKHDK